MEESRKAYYIYSIFAVLFFVILFSFLGYLIYDLILKLSIQDFTNNTVIQALITLIITVFIGGYFNKNLEHRNHKKLELYKIRTAISLNIIDLTSSLYHNPQNDVIRNALISESNKVKLYFNDDVLRILNKYTESKDFNAQLYNSLIEELKKNVK